MNSFSGQFVNRIARRESIARGFMSSFGPRSLPLVLLSLLPAVLSATPTVSAPVVTPSIVVLNQATSVNVTCQLTTSNGDPALLTGGMNLVRLTSGGLDSSIVGVMTAGVGGIYSYTFTDTEAATGQYQLQCTAALSATILRTRSAATTVTVVSAPSVTSLSTTPAAPLANQQFSLTVTGANFDTASAVILINGPGCTPCTVANGALTAKSATSVTGPATIGSGSFTVAVQNLATGATSGTLPLTVAAVPSLTSLSTTPATPVASQQFSLTVVGTNFDTSSAVIVINGPGCTPCTVANSALTAKSATSVTGPATVGSGSFTIAVQNVATGATSATLPLIVGSVPTVTSLSTTPATPLANQQFSLTVVGTNFDPATAQILITGTGCTPCTVANSALTAKSATSVTGPATIGSGSFTVAVQNVVTGATSGTLPLTVAVAPSLTSLSTVPAVPVPSQQFSLTISGANFDPASAQIVITGTGCTPCTVANSALTAKTATSVTGPATLALGTFTVAVQNTATGATSATLPLAITNGTGPNVSSLSTTPLLPVAAQPFTITVSGSNFDPASAQILFTGTGCAPCTVPNSALTAKSATSVTGPATLANSGSFTVAVQNVAASATSGTLPLTVSAPPPPTISSFTPTSGSIGTSVTVTGTNLVSGSTSASVALAAQAGGTLSAPIASATATSLTFVIPAGAATGTLTASLAGANVTSSGTLTIVPSSNFTLSASPASANLITGQSVAYSVQLASNNGFNQLAPLTVKGLPNGVTASFKPTSITAGQTSVLTLTAPSNQAISTATLTVSAAATVDGLPVSQSATASLAVTAPTTSFLGRTVVSNSAQTPLVGVVVSMVGQDGAGNKTGCTGSTVSDSAGNFALTNLAANCIGPQLIGFTGDTVTSPAGTFAGLQLVFTLVSNTVVVSPVLVNLPQVNTAETFNVIQNDTVDQSYTFKTIPGLSVTVYAGTTFTAPDGTKPNPFPLAAIQVPVDRLPDVMPTTTAGVGAFIVAFQPAETVATQEVAVWFPNTLNTAPGTDVPLMTLDPTLGRMVPYGTGTVSTDGTTIIPDIDPSSGSLNHRYGIVHFDWHGPLGGPPNQNDPTPDPNGPSGGEPVDLASGIHVINSTDIGFHGNRGSIALTRTYRTGAVQGNLPGPFGWGSFHNFEYRLDTLTPQSSSVINLILPTGTRVPFNLQANGTLVNTTVPMVAGWVLTTSSNGNATLTQKNGTYFQFTPGIPPTGSVLVAIGDPNGNVTTIVRPEGSPYQISEIDDPAGRKLTFQYSGDTISSITDPIGRTVNYTYNSAGYLATYTNVLGGVTSYTYDSNGNVTQIKDPDGAVTKNTFDANGRVSKQVLPSGGTVTFGYTLVNSLIPTSPVTQTIVTDPLGNATTYRFNTQGFMVSVTDATGQLRTFNRQLGTNQITSVTGTGACPVCGDTTAGSLTFTYDSIGNELSQTDALNETWSYTYDPVYSNITSITDPVGNVTTRSYDAHGNLAQITDARGNTSSFKFSSTGLMASAQDAAGNTTTATYDSLGNLVSVTNPASQTWLLSYDGASRLVAQKDPLGRVTSITYNAANEVVSQVDGNGHTVQLTFDAAGHLASLADANGGKTAVAYDTAGRVSTKTDPLSRAVAYGYDTNDDISSFTNRRGQKATFGVDSLNRVILETYADATVQRTYDSAGRLIQVVDSQSGTFSMSYDAVGRLLKQIGPNGVITYTRDADGRVLSRQVQGQPAVNYTYDANGNLTQAAMGATTVSRAYDVRNLLLSNTRSNGVTGSYTYDSLGRITGISEKNGGTTVFSRAFTYDAAGQMTADTVDQGQALATMATSGAFDADNQLTSFGSATYTSDADGHRLTSTSGGITTSYAWDARGRLQSVSVPGGAVTSFVYDPGNQMIQNSVTASGSTSVQQYILDDASNIVSIQQGGTATAILDGRTPDDIMATVQGTSSVFPMLDQVGSQGAFTDGSGNVVGREFYEPYGAPTATGTPSIFQYASRPLIGTGLYYDRARFYDSSTGRFISEDLLQFSDRGFNLYRYAADNPISYRDPSGLWGFGIQGGFNADAGVVGAGGTLQIQGGHGVFGGGPSGLNAGNYASGAAFAGGPGYGVGAPDPSGNSWGGGGVVGGASVGGQLGGFFTNAHCAADLSDNFDTYFLNLPIGGVSFGTGTTNDGRTIWIFTIGAGPSLGASGGAVTTNTFTTHNY